MPALDLKAAYQEFTALKSAEQRRNHDYYLLREAVKGNFMWPRNWPTHITKYNRNLCKRITRQHVTYLMGKGFSYNINRPNTLEFRDSAERSEKILRRIYALSRAELQFIMGGLNGSQLGRTIFKTYKKGPEGAEHACFSYCQPDYFYGVPIGDNHLDGFSVVYYSYPMDIAEARRVHGPGDYKTEAEMGFEGRYDQRREITQKPDTLRNRRVPVLEIWQPDSYALQVGGVTKYNGDTPDEYRWKDTGQGFIPFTVIENSRNSGAADGEADISEARGLNELYNYLFSLRYHIINRWLRPTLVWEGAPQNYAEILANTISGGGAIPTRLGSRLYFLVHDRPNAAVSEMEGEIRAAILESAGMTDTTMQGTITGSIVTGPGANAQFAPQMASVETKRIEWTYGLQDLNAKLLNVQESIGNSKALGQAVINERKRSQANPDGELVDLSGKDINGLREVSISWPGVLPKDNLEAARFEMEKMSQGLQSVYTTLEKLGEEFPGDEIARVRMENMDPWLKGEKVAEQMDAQTKATKVQGDLSLKQQQMSSQEDQRTQQALASLAAEDFGRQEDENDLGARIRQAAKASQPRLDMEGDEPVLMSGSATGY